MILIQSKTEQPISKGRETEQTDSFLMKFIHSDCFFINGVPYENVGVHARSLTQLAGCDCFVVGGVHAETVYVVGVAFEDFCGNQGMGIWNQGLGIRNREMGCTLGVGFLVQDYSVFGLKVNYFSVVKVSDTIFASITTFVAINIVYAQFCLWHLYLFFIIFVIPLRFYFFKRIKYLVYLILFNILIAYLFYFFILVNFNNLFRLYII